MSKTRPQNCRKLENVFGKIEINLAQNQIFLAQNSIFFNGFPISEKFKKIFFNGFLIFFNGFPISEKSEKIFFNGFPISSTAFRFLQRLSAFFNGFPIFLNGFPLSKKYEKIYLRRQVYERSLFELCISCHLLPELRNSRQLIAIHHTVLQVLKTCMLKWAFN